MNMALCTATLQVSSQGFLVLQALNFPALGRINVSRLKHVSEFNNKVVKVHLVRR